MSDAANDYAPLREEVEKQEERWDKGINAEFDKVTLGFEGIIETIKGWLDDTHYRELFLGILRSITGMERSYVKFNPTSYGPAMMRRDVESLRAIVKRHHKSKAISLAVTVVVLCWTACSMLDDMTSIAGLSDYALHVLLADGRPEDIKGLSHNKARAVHSERSTVGRQLLATFCGGTVSIAWTRSDVKPASTPEKQLACRMAWYVTCFAGQTCVMCDKVHKGLGKIIGEGLVICCRLCTDLLRQAL